MALNLTLSLSVIIPAYNENRFIAEALNRVFNLPPAKEVIVVNDGSTDGTAEIINKVATEIRERPPRYLKNLEVIHKPRNEGKGAAIRSGLDRVKGDIVIIQDADLELNPAEYPRLLKPFETEGADIVFGSRFSNTKYSQSLPSYSLGANKLLTFFSNIFSGLHLTDMETGYKIFKTEIIKSFPLVSRRFNIEPELAARTAKAIRRQHLNFQEIPVFYQPRSYDQGKKINWRDGIAALWWIFYFNLIDQR